ncbi:MAG: uncharacterized protein KVP18_001192 [Porospora cf. gigantea A]|uniref:uncharacterized protein n=1 Tax=Porospora cf. gigantea A TaxID=2853593 RepID=UPI0035599D51|nr:MAG: hypothetical protein KVP18_001192 [Porospora cf. gigantea A]
MQDPMDIFLKSLAEPPREPDSEVQWVQANAGSDDDWSDEYLPFRVESDVEVTSTVWHPLPTSSEDVRVFRSRFALDIRGLNVPAALSDPFSSCCGASPDPELSRLLAQAARLPQDPLACQALPALLVGRNMMVGSASEAEPLASWPAVAAAIVGRQARVLFVCYSEEQAVSRHRVICQLAKAAQCPLTAALLSRNLSRAERERVVDLQTAVLTASYNSLRYEFRSTPSLDSFRLVIVEGRVLFKCHAPAVRSLLTALPAGIQTVLLAGMCPEIENLYVENYFDLKKTVLVAESRRPSLGPSPDIVLVPSEEAKYLWLEQHLPDCLPDRALVICNPVRLAGLGPFLDSVLCGCDPVTSSRETALMSSLRLPCLAGHHVLTFDNSTDFRERAHILSAWTLLPCRVLLLGWDVLDFRIEDFPSCSEAILFDVPNHAGICRRILQSVWPPDAAVLHTVLARDVDSEAGACLLTVWNNLTVRDPDCRLGRLLPLAMKHKPFLQASRSGRPYVPPGLPPVTVEMVTKHRVSQACESDPEVIDGFDSLSSSDEATFCRQIPQGRCLLDIHRKHGRETVNRALYRKHLLDRGLLAPFD